MNRSQSQHTLLTFNCNSKDFSLGWDNGPSNLNQSSTFKKNEFKDFNVTNRGTKFLEKKNYETSAKIGSSEFKVITPTIPKKITRNDKQKSTFYVVGDAPKTTQIKPEIKTEREVLDLSLKFDELKLSDKKKKKEEVTKLNEEKINRLFKKVKEREPFKF